MSELLEARLAGAGTPRPEIPVFDEPLSRIYDDLIRRSIPGYDTIVQMIGLLAAEYARENSNCYDLGCSLGAVTFAMRRHIKKKRVKIIAVDNSLPMIEKCRINLRRDNNDTGVRVQCADIRQVEIKNASVVVLNFTMQFIEPAEREELLGKIRHGLNEGGVLIVSDKVIDAPEPSMPAELTGISQKLSLGEPPREQEIVRFGAIAQDSLSQHHERLRRTGFSRSLLWFRCLDAVSLLAFK